MRLRSFLLTLACAVMALAPGLAQDTEEADRLAALLDWHAGSVVGEIGAGDGQLTLAAAKRVGETGRVFTTELDAKKLAHLEELAASEKNITAIKAAGTETRLPPECCDSIFMRLVYHHITKPVEMDASLFRSLKPGGLLAVIDREPPPGSSPVAGVPANRGGHGMPQKILIEELTAADFVLVKAQNGWSPTNYCIEFRKPHP